MRTRSRSFAPALPSSSIILVALIVQRDCAASFLLEGPSLVLLVRYTAEFETAGPFVMVKVNAHVNYGIMMYFELSIL